MHIGFGHSFVRVMIDMGAVDIHLMQRRAGYGCPLAALYTKDTDGPVVWNMWLIYCQRGGLKMGLPSRR